VCIGHLLMAFEGQQAIYYAVGTQLTSDLALADGRVLAAGTVLETAITKQDTAALNVFYLALTFIVAGVGFLKPNISVIVGKLYPENDPRRDSGFTLFYMGINIGAMVATHVAAQHGRRARSLTVVGPAALGFTRPAVPLEKVRNKHGQERYEANRRNLAMFMFADASRITEEAVAIQDWNTVHARFRSKGFAGSTSLRDAAGRATARLNAVWGDGDVTSFPSIEASIGALRTTRPDAGLHVIKDAGHWVAYEAPEAFNAIALQILRDAEGA
jgi:hypothetical protein